MSIVVDGLTKRYGPKVAVADLSFSVRPGVVTGFLGPNGSGKSTTMRCMLGLDRPDAGGATFQGRPYRSIDRPLFEVGALLDAGYVHPGRSGRNHLRWLAASNGIGTDRVDAALDRVGLSDVGRKPVKGYSLGMKQRLGLAGVLLGDPHTVILDEPGNGLDPEGIRWIRDALRGLAAEGRTVLVSSHLLSEMSLMAQDLVVIGKGRLVEQSTVEAFVAKYGSSSVRVASPQLDRLIDLLRAQGGTVDPLDPVSVRVTGLTSQAVGETAGREGIVLHQLADQTDSLEDSFLRATAEVQEYRTGDA
ncbi:MAG: ATP-binding cassette domain-containing protein [Acidimicrobiales bacterium]|nr:ATP-binding cassette domain-containing protein [Acidimicrobiales bacterium]